MNIKQFTHRFSNGAVVTLSYDLDTHQPGQVGQLKTEWSQHPTKRMVPEYLRWKHGVCDQLATLLGGRLMDVTQTKPHLCEVWIHDPGKAGRKVEEAAWPLQP